MPGSLPAWRLATMYSALGLAGLQVVAFADFVFFLVAGLVALSVLAAALRVAGLFAVFMVLAAAVFSDAAALGAAAFFAAGFAAEAAGLAAFAGVALVLAGARTAMACARGRFVVLSSFIRDAFLDGVA